MASKLLVHVLGMLQGVVVADVELAVVDIVQDHVHTRTGCRWCGCSSCRKVAGDALDLLGHPQQQRAGAAGGIVDGCAVCRLPVVTSLARIMETCCGSVELAGLLAGPAANWPIRYS
jgi:hypothetical protein